MCMNPIETLYEHNHCDLLSFGKCSRLMRSQNAPEYKDWQSDSPGRTREPLQTHTFSPKNNAAGLSSDKHENPLNGTQPNPFVYSSVPTVPRAGNSLPSGALVNGPGSHPTTGVHCCPEQRHCFIQQCP